MAQRLLALVLAATQVTSWGAAPLYLCVGAEGSVTVDLGSDHCTSCRVAESQSTVCASESACCPVHEHDADRPRAPHDRLTAFRTCDCTHFQIVSQQGPIVTRMGSAAGTIRLTAHDFGAACDLSVGSGAAFDACGLPAAVKWTAPPELSRRAPVVLRC